MRDMQFTRIREKLVKSLETALGAFRKRSGRGMCALTFCGGESPPACVKYTQARWHLPLPPVPWWGSGIINSLGGCETR